MIRPIRAVASVALELFDETGEQHDRSLEQTAGTEASMMGYALVVRTPGDPSNLARSASAKKAARTRARNAKSHS